MRPENLRLSRLEETHLKSLYSRMSSIDCHIAQESTRAASYGFLRCACTTPGKATYIGCSVCVVPQELSDAGPCVKPLCDGDLLGTLPLENSPCWESHIVLSVSSTHWYFVEKSPLPQDGTVVMPTFISSLLQGEHFQKFQQFLVSACIIYFCSPMNKVRSLSVLVLFLECPWEKMILWKPLDSGSLYSVLDVSTLT